MTPERVFAWALALGAGLALGGAYFTGLWYTLRQARTARHPAGILLVSWLARIALLLAGLWLVSGGRPDRLALALLGVILGRMATVRVLGARQSADTARSTVEHGAIEEGGRS